MSARIHRKLSAPAPHPDKQARAEVEGQLIGVDDYINVLPPAGKTRGKYLGKIRGIWVKDGVVTGIDVYGGKVGYEKVRTLRLDQVEILGVRKQNSLKRTVVERAMVRADKLEALRERKAPGR